MAAKPILNREFTPREKGLLVALAIVLIVAVYYFLVIRTVQSNEAAAANRLADLQAQIVEQQAINDRMTSMSAALEQQGNLDDQAIIAVYDNFNNEFDELNAILDSAQSFDIDFRTPEATGSLVRRNATVTFETGSIESALDIVSAIEGSSYKCLITDMVVTEKVGTSQLSEGVLTTLSLTYFETTEGSADTSGLVVVD